MDDKYDMEILTAAANLLETRAREAAVAGRVDVSSSCIMGAAMLRVAIQQILADEVKNG